MASPEGMVIDFDGHKYVLVKLEHAREINAELQMERDRLKAVRPDGLYQHTIPRDIIVPPAHYKSFGEPLQMGDEVRFTHTEKV